MELYFLKSIACLAIFLLFYKLVLEKENMHVFKRFYLLTAMLAATAIPFITFTTYVQPSPEVFQPLFLPYSEGTIDASAGISEYLETGLWIIYVLGVFFFSLKFCRNFVVILQRIRKNPKVKDNNFITVLLSEKFNPHTFFNYIFLNKLKYEKQEIPKEVIIHEQAHAMQKHSLDILLLELAQIIFWINPLLFVLKDAIKLNHEFLADDSVLKKGINPTGYKKTLLSYSSGGHESGLANQINYSSIKKRFTVMKTKTSKTAVWARSLLVLPLMAVLVYGFSTKKMIVEPQDQQQINNVQKKATLEMVNEYTRLVREYNNQTEDCPILKLDDLERIKYILNEMSPEQLEKAEELKCKLPPPLSGKPQKGGDGISQEKATSEMVAEYNKMARHYNSMKEAPVIKMKDYERMKYIYGLMTPDQKKRAEAFPVPSPPPTPNENMIAEYNKLAKHYNEKGITEEIVQEDGFKRMFYIYGLMTELQRKNAEELPPPPPPAPALEPVKGEGENMPVPPPPFVKEKTPPVPPVPTGEALPPPPPLVEDLPHPLPPPPPVSFEELVKDGAVFYYNGKTITPEEVRRLVEVEKKVNIHITSTNEEKPVVRLTDKKD